MSPLVADLQASYVRIYGTPDETPVEHGEFDPPRGLFLVGLLDGEPVAIGGWREVEGAVPTAEIKRMYVVQRARRQGLARLMLAELEATIADGWVRAHRADDRAADSAEAIALYESSGYAPVPMPSAATPTRRSRCSTPSCCGSRRRRHRSEPARARRGVTSGRYARVTLPAFRHDVQTVIRRRVPGATSARTVCTFGFHRRWVRRWECETDMPKPGPLPQTSQTLATVASLDSRTVPIDSTNRRRAGHALRRATPGSHESSRSRAAAKPASGSAPVSARTQPDGPAPAQYPRPVGRRRRRGARARRARRAGGAPLEHAAADALDAHRAEIDALNVFPVPDGDTGTNLALTLRAAADALSAPIRPTRRPRRCGRWRTGAVLGARGNSGVIISPDPARAGRRRRRHRGLRRGATLAGGAAARRAEQAYAAVADPVEGTILSVARAAADAAAVSGDGAPWPTVVSAALARRPREALRRTPDQLPVLARAGVVDAGGRGLVVLLDALGRASSPDAVGTPVAPPRAVRSRRAAKRPASPAAPSTATRCSTCCDADDDAGRDAAARAGRARRLAGRRRHRRRRRGTSTSTSTTSARRSRPASRPAGRTGSRSSASPTRSRADASSRGRAGGRGRWSRSRPARGWRTCSRARASTSSTAGPATNPSTADVLAAVLATGAAEVVLLPNAAQVTGVAEAAAERGSRGQGIEVAVVPTPLAGAGPRRGRRPRRRRGASTTTSSRWPRPPRPPGTPR